jgi:cell wall-associated NlpC family hydrolase
VIDSALRITDFIGMSNALPTHRSLYFLLCLSLLLAACSNQRSRPTSATLPRFTAPAARQGVTATNNILFRAIGLVGTPYRYGGNTPETGFDCSGLVDFVFRDAAGVVLPRTVGDLANLQLASIARNELRAGDLIFFDTNSRHASHVGIYVGEDRFVHAPNEGGMVRLDYLSNVYWREHYDSAKRIPL